LDCTDLEYAKLTRANLSGASIAEAMLEGIDLSGSNLSNANFAATALCDANLTGACLRDTTFSEFLLVGANLTNVDLSEAIISLDGADIDRISGAILCNTIMPDGSIRNDHCQ